MFRHLLYIGIGGGLGAISRYLLSGFSHRLLGTQWAWGTLTVNVLGCFIMGCLMALAPRSPILEGPIRDAVAIGFLGALTTFSTFSWETVAFMRNGAYTLAFANLGANCLLCVLGVSLGFSLFAK